MHYEIFYAIKHLGENDATKERTRLAFSSDCEMEAEAFYLNYNLGRSPFFVLPLGRDNARFGEQYLVRGY